MMRRGDRPRLPLQGTNTHTFHSYLNFLVDAAVYSYIHPYYAPGNPTTLCLSCSAAAMASGRLHAVSHHADDRPPTPLRSTRESRRSINTVDAVTVACSSSPSPTCSTGHRSRPRACTAHVHVVHAPHGGSVSMHRHGCHLRRGLTHHIPHSNYEMSLSHSAVGSPPSPLLDPLQAPHHWSPTPLDRVSPAAPAATALPPTRPSATPPTCSPRPAPTAATPVPSARVAPCPRPMAPGHSPRTPRPGPPPSRSRPLQPAAPVRKPPPPSGRACPGQNARAAARHSTSPHPDHTLGGIPLQGGQRRRAAAASAALPRRARSPGAPSLAPPTRPKLSGDPNRRRSGTTPVQTLGRAVLRHRCVLSTACRCSSPSIAPRLPPTRAEAARLRTSTQRPAAATTSRRPAPRLPLHARRLRSCRRQTCRRGRARPTCRRSSSAATALHLSTDRRKCSIPLHHRGWALQTRSKP